MQHAGRYRLANRSDATEEQRINIFERWESRSDVKTFRGSGPMKEQGAAMLSADVSEYDVAAVGPLP